MPGRCERPAPLQRHSAGAAGGRAAGFAGTAGRADAPASARRPQGCAVRQHAAARQRNQQLARPAPPAAGKPRPAPGSADLHRQCGGCRPRAAQPARPAGFQPHVAPAQPHRPASAGLRRRPAPVRRGGPAQQHRPQSALRGADGFGARQPGLGRTIRRHRRLHQGAGHGIGPGLRRSGAEHHLGTGAGERPRRPGPGL